MPDILHRVGMKGSAAKVYDAIATTEGLSHWWSTGTTGDTEVGGVVKVEPHGGGFDLKVLESKPGEIIRWRCVGGPPEWIGTHLSFRIETRGDETFVLFKHMGWPEPVEFMHHCSTKWATYLLSMKSLLEGGRGRPHPHDLHISARGD